MFCPKCGTNLPEEAEFCSSCGTNIKELQDNVSQLTSDNVSVESNSTTNSSETTTEQLSRKTKDLTEKAVKTGKEISTKYKKPIIIGISSFLAIIIGLVLFNRFYDFTKLSWDTKNSDAGINYTSSCTLNLMVNAFDKKNNRINDIKFTTKDGKIESSGSSVDWTLPDKDGEYTIYAQAPSGKKIKKTVTVINFNNEELGGFIEKPVLDTDDTDGDGLTNGEEKKLKTDVNLMDTDMDGLSDYYEVNESKTDPLKVDSDSDGLEDGNEISLGLDPLKADSKGDGIKDGERSFDYNLNDEENGVEISINGKGNVASSGVDVFSNSSFEDREGLINKIYDFYSDGTISSATVKIKYTDEDLAKEGINEDNLSLYYFNEDTKELEEIPTTVDKENKQIIVTLNHFSMYMIGDKTIVVPKLETEILFVIDNSVSMYSESQMISRGYTESKGAVGNDTEFKRLSLTNNLVSMFTGNYKFGVSEFSGDYVKLEHFTDSKTNIKNAVNSMKSGWKSTPNGTNIVDALKSGLSEFSSTDNGNYLILLTDGKNTEGSLGSSKEKIINKALENEIKICVIGLGTDLDTDILDNIAESTGCDYYHATDSSALDEIYSIVGADINYDLVDTDGDNKVDGMIVADSGFVVNRDGFNFANMYSVQSDGYCYGMSLFAYLYYLNNLPAKMGPKDNSENGDNYASNGYDLSNTYFTKRSGNLYDYEIKNEALSMILNTPKGMYEKNEDDGKYYLKEEYKKKFEEIGSEFKFIKSSNGEEGQIAKVGVGTKKFNENVDKEDRELFNALWRLHITQRNDKNYYFNSTEDDTMKVLYDALSEGRPILFHLPEHSINAIKLIKDLESKRLFKIAVYDSNHPGQTKYIKAWQVKNVIGSDENDTKYFYAFSYDGLKKTKFQVLDMGIEEPNVE